MAENCATDCIFYKKCLEVSESKEGGDARTTLGYYMSRVIDYGDDCVADEASRVDQCAVLAGSILEEAIDKRTFSNDEI